MQESGTEVNDAVWRPYPTSRLKRAPILAVRGSKADSAIGFRSGGLAFDPVGNLYLTNYESSRIEKITPVGIRTVFVDTDNLNGPVGLVSDGYKYLYVANYLSGTIVRVRTDNGGTEIIATGFSWPSSILLDPTGDLYVSDSKAIYKIKLSEAYSDSAK